MKDILGNDLAVGDRIALAMRDGNSAEIRVGTIEKIYDKKMLYNPATMEEVAEVSWEAVGGFNSRLKTSTVSLPARRVVKI